MNSYINHVRLLFVDIFDVMRPELCVQFTHASEMASRRFTASHCRVLFFLSISQFIFNIVDSHVSSQCCLFIESSFYTLLISTNNYNSKKIYTLMLYEVFGSFWLASS